MKTEEQVGFVRKVLGIVAAQMALTFAFALFASINSSAGSFFKDPRVLILSLIAFIVCACYLLFNKDIRRTVPYNYMLLGTITVCEATIIASVAANITAMSVLVCIMAVCLSTAGLWLAAVYTSTREHLQRNLMTGLAFAMIANIVVLLIMVFTMQFQDKTLVFVLGVIMLAVSGIFILFDLLMIIVPGAVDKEDYILAALNLYLDIARLFYYILILFGEKKQ